MMGSPESTFSLRDRVRQSLGTRYANSDVQDAGRQVDTGGMSAAGFGQSPIAQGGYGQSSQHAGSQARRIYDGYDPAVARPTSSSRLVQRINPMEKWRGGVAREYESA